MRADGARLAVATGLGLVIWFLPPPQGVTPQAWHLLAIVVATIVGIVLEPLPMGAIAVCGITALTLTGTLDLGQALSGFGHSVIWLVVGGAWWKLIGVW